MIHLRRLAARERLERNVTLSRVVEVGTSDLSAQHLAAAWLERQLRKDIKLLSGEVVMILHRLRLTRSVSQSYVECWGVIAGR